MDLGWLLKHSVGFLQLLCFHAMSFLKVHLLLTFLKVIYILQTEKRINKTVFAKPNSTTVILMVMMECVLKTSGTENAAVPGGVQGPAAQAGPDCRSCRCCVRSSGSGLQNHPLSLTPAHKKAAISCLKPTTFLNGMRHVERTEYKM